MGSLEALALTEAFDDSPDALAGSDAGFAAVSDFAPLALGSLASFAGAEVAAVPFFP
jgi:hypothetical protein